MKYSEFYEQAKNKLAESIGNMWFKGNPDIQSRFKTLVTEEEPLLSEPIFQTIFPWKSSPQTFGEHATKLHLLRPEFVRALDSVTGDNRFPLDRYPHTHQTASWMAMLENKSIVVTSGTGSGKTECFMVPVLHDLDQNPSGGVQAIFLYPLNALMSDQQKRLDDWCRVMNPQVTYAVYNGDTPETASAGDRNAAYPQLIDREKIRQNPPKILFTNPTMLNYMLLRSQDSNILKTSAANKSLKWILLDEAHTYTGSSATELALQIRRVIDAFGVSIDDVNFAVTSATMSGDDDVSGKKELLEMVSRLTGKPTNDIVIIDGERIVPDLDPEKFADRVQEMNRSFGLSVDVDTIKKLRVDLNESPSLSLSDICNCLGFASDSIVRKLELLDFLGDKVDGLGVGRNPTTALLPTRIHLFTRSLDGLYACTNEHCTHGLSGDHIWDHMTTYQTSECPYCGAPMLEVVACPDCGELFLTGKQDAAGYHMSSREYHDDFELFDDEQDEKPEEQNSPRFFVSRSVAAPCPRRESFSTEISFASVDNTWRMMLPGEDAPHKIFQRTFDKDKYVCPSCGTALHGGNMKSFFVGSAFLGTQLSEVILNQSEPAPAGMSCVHSGQKYITFTDSRNTTARSAMSANLNVESRWTMAFVYHKLLQNGLINGRLDAAQTMLLSFLEGLGDNRDSSQEAMYQNLLKIQNEYHLKSITWSEMKGWMAADTSFQLLFDHLSDAKINRYQFKKNGSPAPDNTFPAYLDSLLLNQFNRIPKHGNTLETLGLVHLVYPGLDLVESPMENRITTPDWREFLKVCVDYFVRDAYAYVIPQGAKMYFPQGGYSNHLYGPDCTLKDTVDHKLRRWPLYDIDATGKQSKLIHLASALLGYSSVEDIDTSDINFVLRRAWHEIVLKVLTLTDTQNNDPNNWGYKLDFTNDKVKIALMDGGWTCPVEYAVVDTLIKGYSPRIKGYLSEENFRRFHVGDENWVRLPFFPYPMLMDAAGNKVSPSTVKDWIQENAGAFVSKGVYSDILTDILNYRPIYLTSEHSAQIDSKIREQSVEKFKKGQLNVLACSTTMEMGVDLGGLSEVVMNTVPPKPANYLQRVGRAGRREESKALALTFCSATPIGTNAWEHPDWPMTHSVQMPQIKMESCQIIQRNVNSLLFSYYVRSQGGMTLGQKISDFFENHLDGFKNFLDDTVVNGTLKANSSALCRGTALEKMPFAMLVSICKDEISRLHKIYSAYVGQYVNALVNVTLNTARYKVITSHLEKYKNTDLLSYFADNGFIPSAGIPVGLVEFQTRNDIRPFDKDLFFPSKHLSAAIAEYAPGSQIVVNEWCYKSSGIGFKSAYGNDADQSIIQKCRKCGYTTIVRGEPLQECPCCHEQNTMRGVFSALNDKFTKTIEPSYFCVDSRDSARRNLRTQQVGYVSPVLLRMKRWGENRNHAVCMFRSSSDYSENERPEILFYNRGAADAGYAVCPFCGRVESETDTDHLNLMTDHRRIDDGSLCDGNGKVHNHVVLVGSNKTDFVEMKFFDKDEKPISEKTLLYTLGEIFTRELTNCLGVNEGEIGYGLNPDFDSLFIYDTAIGGSGYSVLFSDYKDQIFDAALESLEACDCKKACTKCLIDRHSQWHLDLLDRNVAIAWLKMERFRRSAPENIRKDYPDVTVVTADLSSEIAKILNSTSVRRMCVFLSDDIANWSPTAFPYHESFCRSLHNIPVSYVIENNVNLNLLTADRIASTIDILMDEVPFYKGKVECQYTPLFLLERQNGDVELYFSDEASNQLDETWGQGVIYRTLSDSAPSFSELSKMTLLDSLRDICVAMHFSLTEKNIMMSNFLEKLKEASGEANKWDRIATIMKGKEVEVRYTDKYLISPFATYVLISLIKIVIDTYQLQLRGVTFHLSKSIGYGKDRGTEFDNPYKDVDTQIKTIKSYCKDLLGPEVITTFNYDRIRQHERDIIFHSDDQDFVILPNGGIDWGILKDLSVVTNRAVKNISDIKPDSDLGIYLCADAVTYTVVMKQA